MSIRILCTACALVVGFNSALSQDSQIKFPMRYSDFEQQMIYDVYKKDPQTAVLLSSTLLSLGYMYTENWEKAVGLIIVKGAIIGSMTSALKNDQNVNVVYLGSSALILVYLFELVDVTSEVEKYNSNLFTRITGKPISISVNSMNKGVGMNIALSF